MKRGGFWWFFVFGGTLLLAAGIKSWFFGPPRPTSLETALNIVELVLGVFVVLGSLFMVIKAGKTIIETKDESLRLNDDE